MSGKQEKNFIGGYEEREKWLKALWFRIYHANWSVKEHLQLLEDLNLMTPADFQAKYDIKIKEEKKDA